MEGMLINNKVRIRKLDASNIVVETLEIIQVGKAGQRDGTTREDWQIAGYYGTVEHALIGAQKVMLEKKIEENPTVKEMLDKIKESKEQILKAVKNGKVEI